MAAGSKKSPFFSSCCLLMSFIFLYSASVQLNDPDWYFWFPLYTIASSVNFLSMNLASEVINRTALLALWSGMLLFLKVVVEAHVNGLGFWSLDMGERLVREKIGSGLVVFSMFFHSKSSSVSRQTKQAKPRESAGYVVVCGMAMLVAVTCGLCIYYFVCVEGYMRLGV